MSRGSNIFSELVKKSIELSVNAVMGESKLPVLKLGGSDIEGSVVWELLARESDNYSLDKLEELIKNGERSYPVGGLLVKRSTQSGNKKNKSVGCYAINCFSLSSLKDGDTEYLQIALRTSGTDSGFGYFIEANKTVDSKAVRSYCAS